MIHKEDVYIDPLDTMRTIHVYLPDDIGPDERFPVMYMFDGHNLFFDDDSTYGKSWGIKDYLDNSGVRMIIVGIECNHEGNLRLGEFSPYSFKDKDWGKVKGRGKEVIDWMADQLKPYIDENFPTISDRLNTGIGGSSMGGLMAIYGVAIRSDVFSRGACLSPYYEHIFGQLVDEISSAYVDPETYVYISWGRYEFFTKKQFAVGSEKSLIMGRILTLKGAKVFPHIMVDGRHDEASWETETEIWMDELGFKDM